MSQLEVDKVIPQSGTDITLGDSADTITIPSGATLDATNATVTYPAGSITDAAISSIAAIQQSKSGETQSKVAPAEQKYDAVKPEVAEVQAEEKNEGGLIFTKSIQKDYYKDLL
jgi:hypothetical protein